MRCQPPQTSIPSPMRPSVRWTSTFTSSMASALSIGALSLFGFTSTAYAEEEINTTTSTTPAAAPADAPPAELKNAEGDAIPNLDGFGEYDGGDTYLRMRLDANHAYQQCEQKVALGQSDAAACLQKVVDMAPDSTAAFRAKASLRLLEIQKIAGVVTEQKPATGALSSIKPGRLEVAGVSGLFGIWNGIALGVVYQASFPQTPAQNTVLTTALLSTGLGVGLGFAGYNIAENLNLDEGASRLLSSNLVWGTIYGIEMVPMILNAVSGSNNGALSTQLSIGTVVLGGYVGAATSLLFSSNVKTDTAQVSLYNTGGLFGLWTGALLLPNLFVNDSQDINVNTLAFVAANTAGLAAGALAAQKLHFNWGETLIMDGGAVIGGLLGGAVSFLLGTSGVINGLDPRASTAMVTAIPWLGSVGGMVGSAALLATWREQRGEPVWRDDEVGIKMGTPKLTFAVDKANQIVPIVPMIALEW